MHHKNQAKRSIPLPYKTTNLPSFPSIYDTNQIKSYGIISENSVTRSFHKQQFNLIFLHFPYTTNNFQILSFERGSQGLILHASRFAFGSCGFELFLQSLPSDQVCEACFFKLCPPCRRGCQRDTGAGEASSDPRVPARLRARHGSRRGCERDTG